MTAWFVSDLVGNPEDSFSHDMSHITIRILSFGTDRLWRTVQTMIRVFTAITLASFVRHYYMEGSPCCVLEQDIFTPQKVLVIPSKRWLHPNMTEKLFTGTLSIKQKKRNIIWRKLLEFSSICSNVIGLCRVLGFYDI